MMRKGLIVCLALGGCLAMAQRPSASPGHGARTIEAGAWQVFELANRARAAAGMAPLEWDPALAAAALAHCQMMAEEGPIAHRYRGEADVAGRAAAAGAHFNLIEENVAFAPTPAAVHEGWMNSPHHRENLMNPAVDRVGVALVASRGSLYAVADYARDVPVMTQAGVEAEIGRLIRAAGAAILSDTKVARATCAMDHGLPASRSELQPLFVMRWEDASFSVLPKALASRLATGQYHKASVGSCPTRDGQDSFTAYRVAVLLY